MVHSEWCKTLSIRRIKVAFTSAGWVSSASKAAAASCNTARQFGGFPNSGVLVWGSLYIYIYIHRYKKDYSILGSILGSPYFGKLPFNVQDPVPDGAVRAGSITIACPCWKAIMSAYQEAGVLIRMQICGPLPFFRNRFPDIPLMT